MASRSTGTSSRPTSDHRKLSRSRRRIRRRQLGDRGEERPEGLFGREGSRERQVRRVGRRVGFAGSSSRRSSIFSSTSRTGRTTFPSSTNRRHARKLINLRNLRLGIPSSSFIDTGHPPRQLALPSSTLLFTFTSLLFRLLATQPTHPQVQGAALGLVPGGNHSICTSSRPSSSFSSHPPSRLRSLSRQSRKQDLGSHPSLLIGSLED